MSGHRKTSHDVPKSRGEDRAMMLAGFVIFVCGVAALIYIVCVRRGIPPERPEQERDKNQRFLRDAPPPW